jgi:hypothetical protein
MWAVDDAGIFVCEWLFRIRVYEQTIVLYREGTLRKSLGFNAASVLDDSSLGHWIAVVRECFLD